MGEETVEVQETAAPEEKDVNAQIEDYLRQVSAGVIPKSGNQDPDAARDEQQLALRDQLHTTLQQITNTEVALDSSAEGVLLADLRVYDKKKDRFVMLTELSAPPVYLTGDSKISFDLVSKMLMDEHSFFLPKWKASGEMDMDDPIMIGGREGPYKKVIEKFENVMRNSRRNKHYSSAELDEARNWDAADAVHKELASSFLAQLAKVNGTDQRLTFLRSQGMNIKALMTTADTYIHENLDKYLVSDEAFKKAGFGGALKDVQKMVLSMKAKADPTKAAAKQAPQINAPEVKQGRAMS